MKQLLLILTIALMMGACTTLQNHGVIQNRGTDYLKARSIQPLAIPPGMSSSTIHTEYPVSSQYYPTATKEISLIPPELNNTH